MKNKILGIMSGTSLDGLDFALCNFEKKEKKYSFKIIKTQFCEYEKEIKNKLATAQNLKTYEFLKFHKKYGEYIGKKVNTFLKNTEKPDFIASHGHTVFHNPAEKISVQIGDGAFIAAQTGISTVSDFRNLDIASSGQGAPLVPVGDKLLFPEYAFCLNLGGFANISFDDKNNTRIAYDICPFNFIINLYARKKGKEYDKNGEIAKSGKINTKLYHKLNEIEYYKKTYPKSTGREYVEKVFFPIFDKFNIPEEDILRTFYEHAAYQISKSLNNTNKNKEILITGGGAHNTFFMNILQNKINISVKKPEKEIIDFKEAIIFAFLGFLRINGEINTFSSVTGADKDTSGGNIYLI